MSDASLNSLLVAQGLDQVGQATGPNLKDARSPQEAERVAKQFEGMFLSQLMSAMWQGVDMSGGMFGGGVGEKAYAGLLHEEYAKVFSQTGGIGLSDRLKTEILALQGQKAEAEAEGEG